MNHKTISSSTNKHGNTKTLKRNGKGYATAYGCVDDLSFGYNGNQLSNLTQDLNRGCDKALRHRIKSIRPIDAEDTEIDYKAHRQMSLNTPRFFSLLRMLCNIDFTPINSIKSP